MEIPRTFGTSGGLFLSPFLKESDRAEALPLRGEIKWGINVFRNQEGSFASTRLTSTLAPSVPLALTFAVQDFQFSPQVMSSSTVLEALVKW